MTDPDDLRGSLANPVVAMQEEVFRALERYEEVIRAEPGYVAALLVEYADSIREVNDLDLEVEELVEDSGVLLLHFGDGRRHAGWVGAPRTGKYADVDSEALSELIGEDVEDGGISAYRSEFDRDDDRGGLTKGEGSR